MGNSHRFMAGIECCLSCDQQLHICMSEDPVRIAALAGVSQWGAVVHALKVEASIDQMEAALLTCTLQPIFSCNVHLPTGLVINS